ncbi:hypothetical protein [Priestia megaterium]|nr:hypothetical protein [Priestia megaterium]MED4218333.1 hypothetical protein [Priestia megaterium]WEZ39689.1 hypothetical protein P5636_05295 [Priestia megaterium DSM 319]
MYWGVTTVLAVVLHGYQYIVEKVIRQTNDSQSRLQALKANIQKGSSHRWRSFFISVGVYDVFI